MNEIILQKDYTWMLTEFQQDDKAYVFQFDNQHKILSQANKIHNG